MPQMRGDGARGPLDCYGICLNAIAANPRHRSGNADRGGDTSTLVQNRRSEEHTSELQSRLHLVCRLLLEKKKNTPDRIGRSAITDIHDNTVPRVRCRTVCNL